MIIVSGLDIYLRKKLASFTGMVAEKAAKTQSRIRR